MKRSVSILTAMVAILLAACQPVRPAPIVDRDAPPSRKIDYHYVARGETLFDIAWRYELDMDTLAQVNNIPAPYHLSAGQKLSLDLRGQQADTGSQTVTASGVVVQAVPEGGGLVVRESPSTVAASPTPSEPGPAETPVAGPVVSGPAAADPVPAEPTIPVSPSTEPDVTTERDETEVAAATPPPEPQPESTLPVTPPYEPAPPSEGVVHGGVTWHWPIPGKVSKHYDAAGVLKGVHIQSTQGAPVYPAAPGVVVYAGEGLRGYGRLIIIKHSNEYLTAYAHNRLILVEEGASVTRDSVIAEVGGEIDRAGSLYFEVRKNGKPIDPAEVMPAI